MSEERRQREVFGSWLRTLREEQDKTRKACASAVGVSAAQWGRWEDGSSLTHGRETIRRIAEVLRVPQQEIYERAGLGFAQPIAPFDRKACKDQESKERVGEAAAVEVLNLFSEEVTGPLYI